MKHLSYDIKPCENGYILEMSWMEKDNNEAFSNYKSKRYIYSSWSEVAEWVKNNELEIPPQ